MSSIDAILKPLIKTAFVLDVQPATTPLSLVASKFGGKPYQESGETWPQCPTCKKPLSFICQLDIRQTNHPARFEIPFFSFYYCWDCSPWGLYDEAEGQWVVRQYRDPSEKNAVVTHFPSNLDYGTECQVLFQETLSLPDWEGVNRWCPEAAELSCQFNDDAPWEAYRQAVERLVGEQEINSKTGGYPKWIQGEDTPEDSILLAQIDSEDEAGIMWGDVGSVYLFLSQNPEAKIKFVLQCC